MPEGDTIAKLATRLHERLAGRTLMATDFRVPSLATVDLAGGRVERIDARGKHILMRVDSGDTIHSHLKMDGEWRVAPNGRRPPGRWHEIRVVLTTAEWIAVGSRLGILEIWPTSAEAEHLGHLGPDVLGPGWDAAEAVRRLTADPSRPVGDALIDQRVMAGPGNVYRSEICFLRGVDPRTEVGDVRDPAAMVALTKRVMEANRNRFERVTTGNTRDGQRLWVYGRAGEPCRRCGTAIVRIMQGDDAEERVAYLCPSCQPRLGWPLGTVVAVEITEPTTEDIVQEPPPRAVVLVEGASDRRALEALARRRRIDLPAEGISIVAMGGSKNIRRFLDTFGPSGRDVRLAGLCDEAEEPDIRRALERAGLGSDLSREDMERLGFFVCVADLEEELIRALGPDAVIEVIESSGELPMFVTFRKQPEWRERPVADQLRRFLGVGSGRKIRLAPSLVEHLDLDRVPRPLDAVLAHVRSR